MRSLGSRQTLSGCLNAWFPDDLGNGVDDNNPAGFAREATVVWDKGTRTQRHAW
jgi:hypothetical protein